MDSSAQTAGFRTRLAQLGVNDEKARRESRDSDEVGARASPPPLISPTSRLAAGLGNNKGQSTPSPKVGDSQS